MRLDTHTHKTDNLETPISLQHMSLDSEGNQRALRKPPKLKENMKLRPRRMEVGIKPLIPEVQEVVS